MSTEIKPEDVAYLYETEKADVHLTSDEESIMKAMRSLNKLWKKYKSKPGSNKLILFAGGTGCDIRYETPSAKNVIESYEHITCDGGDGGDRF